MLFKINTFARLYVYVMVKYGTTSCQTKYSFNLWCELDVSCDVNRPTLILDEGQIVVYMGSTPGWLVETKDLAKWSQWKAT
jgi:hypothetical protein